MLKYKTTKEQLIEERNKNTQLRAELYKATADVEYIAMMTDIELEEETESEDDEQV